MTESTAMYDSMYENKDTTDENNLTIYERNGTIIIKKGVVIMSMITVGETLQSNDCTFAQRQADIALMEKKEAEARERVKHSPYDDFAQLNLDPNCGKVRRQLMIKSGSAFAIFDFLIEKADNYNAVVCSPKVFEEALGLGETTVFRAINLLKKHKFLDVKKSGGSNVYLLNKELVWKSWGTNYKYAEFGAKVIITESEQEKPTKTTRMNVVSLKEDSQPSGKDSQSTEESEWGDSSSWEREECPPEE